MNFFNAIIIGFVQGVGEFLPISSSGHLVLLYALFNINNNTVILSIFLHIATLFSILYVYRKEILELIKHPFCKTNKLLVLATIPTVILALLLKGLITDSFDINFVIFGFLITAVTLGIADYLSENREIVSTSQPSTTNNIVNPQLTTNKKVIYHKKSTLLSDNSITDIHLTWWQALIMGVSQGLACFPGISRSGSTIASGLIAKGDKEQVTTFSFLMSIPIIFGSLIMALFDLGNDTLRISTIPLITACIISFLIGIVGINLLKEMIKRQKLSYFSFYLIGLVFLILLIKFVA